MSLSGALSAAVSGLNSQSNALAIVATNLANTSTTGYKAVSASFASLLTDSDSKTGGVSMNTVSNVSAQGLLATSTTTTNMAISGNGFFVVSTGPGTNDTNYTRNGEFSVDNEGYLVSNGYYLQGWATDADGNVLGTASTDNLVAVDTNAISTIAKATSTASMIANLPAEAAVNDTFTSSLEVYDSLGTAATSTVTWEKTAANTWTATFSDPTLSSDPTQTIGTVTSAPVTIKFNTDGTLASTTPASPKVTIGSWTTGAANSSIALDMGAAGTATGLSQYSSGATTLSVTVETTQDGVAFGTLNGIEIGDNGTVNALYDNGMTRAIYKIPVATFANSNGLTALSGGIYSASTSSGTSTLRIAGTNGAGDILGSRLELSTTDTNEEFSKMMAAQQAYSGAAQVMSAASSMFDTLISAVR
jgi:flagellar hook protein FlgE